MTLTAIALVTTAGDVLELPVDRWYGEPTPEEEGVLRRAVPPVLDVGCGPGRHVLALAERGVPSLGIDVSGAALAEARRKGAPVLERSIFEPVPGTGRWGSALLLDGNIGIGGDPAALLRRVAQLLRPGGQLLVELEPPDGPAPVGRFEARLERAGIDPGPWFPWARVAASGAAALAAETGCRLDELWSDGGRWFAALLSPSAQT